MRYVQYALFLLLAICGRANAQTSQFPKYNLASRHITINDGLQSNSITSLLQDPDGYIWIGTNNGLCRYDGYNIVVFRSISPAGKITTDQHIGTLRKDASNMYVQTANTSVGTYNFKQSRFIAYQAPDGKRPANSKKIEIFKRVYQGYTYEFLSGGILKTYDTKHQLIKETIAYKQSEINGTFFLADKQGKLWIFPREGNIRQLDILTSAKYTTNKKRKYFVASHGKHEYYIATYGNGLFHYNMTDGTLNHYTAQDYLPVIQSNFLTTLLIDREGCIWTGSEDAGVSCITPSLENTARYIYPEATNQGDWSNNIRALYVFSDQEAYIGTQQDKVYRCNLTTGATTLVKKTQDQVFKIQKDKKGNLWIGTRGDGIYINDLHYTPKDHSHFFPSNMAYDFTEDSKERMWIATWGSGLLLANTQCHPFSYQTFLNQEITQSRIHDLELSSNGILWIATANGIYSIDTKIKDIKKDDFKHYCIADKTLVGDEIICLKYISQHKLYAGITGVGLVECHLDSHNNIDKYEVVNETLHINTNIVNSIEQDLYGYLWVGTELGIYHLSPNYTDIQKYEYSPILTSNSYSENTSGITPSGNLLFGTRNGLVIIKPQPANSNAASQPCLITDFQINGKSIFGNSELKETNLKANKIELAHNQNTINIYFSRFNYKSQYNVYQYYLEGINNEWQPSTTQSYASYQDLPSGSYTFHVRSVINGIPQPETTFSITIHPPLYATWWATLIYLIIIGAVIYKLYHNRMERFHIHQQMKMEKQLTEFRLNFFTHVAHEFRTPLAIIQSGIDRLNDYKGSELPQAAISSANRGTQRLLRLVNQFLEFRRISSHAVKLNVSKGNIIDFIQLLYKDFRTIASQKDINLTFTSFEKQYEVSFDHEKMETIIYNLLSNAVKYTPQKGNIDMKLTHENGQLVLLVCNQGDEITTERKEHLFQPFMQGYTSQGGMGIGLYLAYQYAKEHKGNLTYSYVQEKQQNVFELTIPANDNQYAPEDYQTEATTYPKACHESQTESLANIVREMQGEALNTQHVAIIEDDPDMMEQLKREVGTYFKIDAYMNGQQGYAGVLTAPPSLILCDVMLPDMNGYDIVKRLRATASLRKTPIIMLTAFDDEEHQIKGYKCGADDYMTKPYNPRILLTRIIQLIRWSQTKQETQEQETSMSTPSTAPTSTSPTSTPLKEVVLESKADKLFRENVVKIIAQNISEPDFTVDKIAEKMHMGRTKFFGKMKELTGMSPNKYLQAERMRIAAELLTDGRYNVSEVCMKVGIQDSSYFYKCFKAKYGMPPSKYAQSQLVEKE